MQNNCYISEGDYSQEPPLKHNMPNEEALKKLREIKNRQQMRPGFQSLKPNHAVESFMNVSRENAQLLDPRKSPRIQHRPKHKL